MMSGTSDLGVSCTNDPPAAWMTMTLTVTVTGLTKGSAYNLYQYSFPLLDGKNEPLAVPTKNFNAEAALASSVTAFVATSSKYVKLFNTTSDKVEIFRAVSVSAP